MKNSPVPFVVHPGMAEHTHLASFTDIPGGPEGLVDEIVAGFRKQALTVILEASTVYCTVSSIPYRTGGECDESQGVG